MVTLTQMNIYNANQKYNYNIIEYFFWCGMLYHKNTYVHDLHHTVGRQTNENNKYILNNNIMYIILFH